MKVVVVIPALDEEATVGRVVAGARRVGEVVLVDGGSRDATPARAREAGAHVVFELRRGYGRACLAGVERARAIGADVVAFVDAALAEDPADLPWVVAPIDADRADLVVGSRVQGAEPGALAPLQRAGNALACWIIERRFGHRYSDLGSMRAIRLDALDRLHLRELGHGWPVEMQVAALGQGSRVTEVPIRYRRRQGGRSKVSGSPIGAARAGAAILRVALGARR